MRRLASLALAATLLAATQPAFGWGKDGHNMINRLAGQYLPADVPAFLRNGSALDTLEYLGPEPDRWRNRAEDELSQTQAADHFIDLEWAAYGETSCSASSPTTPSPYAIGQPTQPLPGCIDGKLLPRKRYDFLRALTAAQPAHPDLKLTPEKVGLQPWATEEMWQKLKVDLREYRHLVAANQDTAPVQIAILYDAGILGHYVGDGSMPLHTSFQYNGWNGPNPNGYTTEHKIHSLFESVNVSANVKIGDVAPLVAATTPAPIPDEWTAYLDYLRHTHTLVEKTYQLEKSGGFTGAGTPEGKAFTDERLAAGAIQLRDMIYAAWLHSADPVEEYKGN
jgi:hypothetical protein